MTQKLKNLKKMLGKFLASDVWVAILKNFDFPGALFVLKLQN